MNIDANIYQRLAEVMKSVNYVQKDTAVQGGGSNYMAVSHDAIVALTRKSFIEYGILVSPELLRSEILVQRNLDLKTPIKMMLYSGDYAISFINIDKPEDRHIVTINAHAADNGDKAPGKALSHATKSAILKVLLIETGVNDESRAYEPELFTPDQKEELDRIIEVGDTMGSVVLQRTTNPETMAALFNSFEKGTITKNKTALRELQAKGWDQFKEIAEIVKTKGSDDINPGGDDSIVLEVINELDKDEKKVLTGLLEKEDIDYLKSLKN